MATFVLEGPKWGSTGLGTAGGIVTWAIDATIPASFLTTISSAFADWAHYANIQFQEVASTVSSQIDFSLGAIDGLNNVLGQTNYFYSGTIFTSAYIEFDSGEGWHVAGSQIVSNDSVNLFELALHEIGHAIGLGHYNAAPAVMNAYLDPTVTDLMQPDIAGAQAIYGHAPASTAAAINTPPVATIADHSLQTNQWSQVASWVSYSDADGNAATQYQFWDSGTGANSGYFWTPEQRPQRRRHGHHGRCVRPQQCVGSGWPDGRLRDDVGACLRRHRLERLGFIQLHDTA